MQVKSKHITLQDQRTIVISDIHGNGHLLKQLLKQCEYQENIDHLILLGDYIEKGRDSLGTLRLIMELSRNERVDILMGNCDAIPVQVLSGEDLMGLCHYLIHAPWSGHTLLQEMANAIGVELTMEENVTEKLQQLVKSFPEEFSFLERLPHVLESEQYLFVHAGLDSPQEPYAEDAYTIMKNDRFAFKDVTFEKMLICGHTPVINYTTTIPCALPLYDEQRHIYSIDGGSGVKCDGQLNALIIEQDHFTHQYVDDLVKAQIQEDWLAHNQEVHTINWFDRNVSYLMENGKGVRCLHLSSQTEVVLPKSYLYKEGEKLCTKDFSDHRLSVKQGDIVGIIEDWEDEVYVKKDGVYGWIPKRVIG